MQNLHKLKNFMKSIFKTPTAHELALIELEEAKRELLRSQSAQEYAGRIVQYHQDRIKRLTAYVSGSTEADQ